MSGSSRPDFIKNISEIPAEPYDKKGSGIAGSPRDVGGAVGSQLIGVDVTEIPPGRKSSYLHHHQHKEEFFFVLSGRCRIKIGETSYELETGDAVSRPPGTGLAHQFENHTGEPCRVLMLGVMAGKGVEDVVVWPEIKRKLLIDPEGKTTLKRL